MRIKNKLDIEENYELALTAWDENKLTDAYRLFLKTAKLGHPDSENAIAQFYELGLHVEIDFRVAQKWYESAIFHGDVCALSNLAGLFLKQNNINEAQNLYKKALEEGDNDALVELAKVSIKLGNIEMAIDYLEKGKHVPKNTITEATLQEIEGLLDSIGK